MINLTQLKATLRQILKILHDRDLLLDSFQLIPYLYLLTQFQTLRSIIITLLLLAYARIYRNGDLRVELLYFGEVKELGLWLRVLDESG